MLILRILLKVALLPVVLILLLLKVIVKVGMQILSVVLGGLILFVAGCLIYTITRQAWSQTFLLVLIEAAVMGQMTVDEAMEAAQAACSALL